MKYVRVIWKHTFPNEPVAIYSELDDQRWEKRKVELFRDGRYGYASSEGATGTTGLALVQTPDAMEISKDSQFEASEISAREFEEVWTLAHDK